MKKLVIGMLLSSVAMADGWICENAVISAKVFHNTKAFQDTSAASIFVLSNPEVQQGNKTIAVFKASEETLVNVGNEYFAKVDLRRVNKGEDVLGTKLGHVDQFVLEVKAPNQSLRDGQKASGKIVVVKRNGDSYSQNLTCVRHVTQK